MINTFQIIISIETKTEEEAHDILEKFIHEEILKIKEVKAASLKLTLGSNISRFEK